MNEKELTRLQFEQNIREDPSNEAIRKIFADWLDDNDFPEDADFYRSFTIEDYEQCKLYLEHYCERLCEWNSYERNITDYDGDEIKEMKQQHLSYDQLIEKVNEYLDKDKVCCLSFDTPDFVFDEKKKFWTAFSIVTGRRIATNYISHTIFRCAC